MISASDSARLAPWLEQAWLDRYLDRQLSLDEAAWFEAYMLDQPELLAAVEADTSLRDALAADAAAKSADRLGRPSERSVALADARLDASSAAHATVRRGSLPRWVAMAATLVLGAGVGWIGSRSVIPATDALKTVASPTRIVFESARGANVAPRVEHADSASPYALIEIPVPPDATDIRLTLGSLRDEPLIPSADGFVSFLIDRNVLRSGQTARLAYVIDGRPTERNISLSTVNSPQR